VSASNLPPGVSAADIPGNRPEDEGWEKFHDVVDVAAKKYDLSDVDAFVAWEMGLSAFLIAREMKVKFLHDPDYGEPRAKPRKKRSVAEDEADERLAREAFENFPEAAIAFDCRRWDYEAFDFEFVDDAGKSHRVRLTDALRGLRVFCGLVDAGKLPGLELRAGYREDTGLWDAAAFDALLQCAIFGRVIYG
jgi:hypothetical protein